MKIIINILTIFIIHSAAFGQVAIDGHVYGENEEPLIGASVYFTAYDIGILTDQTGLFKLEVSNFTPGSVIVSFVGFKADTSYITEPGHYDITLKEGIDIGEVTVQGRSVGTGVSDAVQKIETINSIELTKAACCDLAGCFNTQGSVQVNTTNVVTNSKELRLLGLSGVYNQLLLDGMPLFMGNAYTFGISHYPGTLIHEISVAKGTTSILQGYDAMSGQINVITRKFEQTPSLFLNGYINNFGEKQMNYSQSYAINDQLKATTNIHAVLPSGRFDMNEDGFIDKPLIKRTGVYQTFEYGDTHHEGYSNLNSIQYLNEERTGGRLDYDPAKHLGTTTEYGQFINTSQVNVMSKHFYRWSGRQGVGIYGSYQFHDQDSWFGLLRYQSKMHNANIRAQIESVYGKEHMIKAGISYRNFNINETISFAEEESLRSYDGIYQRIEHVPGIYIENTLNLMESRLNLITGFRLDRHSEFGNFYTPRMLLRYQSLDNWTFRFSAGKGYRTVNLFSEYAQITGGSRDLVILETPEPEESYNVGFSLQKKQVIGDWWLEYGADFFYTYFNNQVFPDFDSDPLKVFVSNTRNQVQSYSSQLDLKIEYQQWLELKIIYNYLDVYNFEDSEKTSLPFLMKHRLTNTLSIRPLSIPWYFDINAHWNGVQRLPDNHQDLPEIFRTDLQSTPYWDLNFQVTYKVKKWELYAGVENILGFMQFNPIRSADDPFGPYFDITSVWGPTRGREYYLGFRYTIDRED